MTEAQGAIQPDVPPDELQAQLLKLKRDVYPLMIVFYITRKLLEDLGITAGLEPETADTLVFNAMIKRLTAKA